METTKDKTKEILNILFEDKINTLQNNAEDKIKNTKEYFDKKVKTLKDELSTKIDIIKGDMPLILNIGTIEKPKRTTVHKSFETIIKILKSAKRKEKNIMLTGEAGSGKTHLAKTIADTLKLQFYPMSVGLQTTKSDLLGFINAQGNYITSPVREAYEKGGILLLDEFDATHAGVVTILNSLLANGHCSFPDKIIEKHKNFICICACNTFGKGGNIEYVGRNRLDGATLDRFIMVNVDYDDKLEKILTKNNEWLKTINKIRKNAQKQGIKIIISPRASMDGADLLDIGFNIDEVINMTILKGADEDIKIKLLEGINTQNTQNNKNPKRKINIDFDNNKYEINDTLKENIEEIECIKLNNHSIQTSNCFTPYIRNTQILYLNPDLKYFENNFEENIKDFINDLENIKNEKIQNLKHSIQLNITYKNILKTYILKGEQDD